MHNYISVGCVLSSLICVFNTVNASGKDQTVKESSTLSLVISPRSWKTVTDEMSKKEDSSDNSPHYSSSPHSPYDESDDSDDNHQMLSPTAYQLAKKQLQAAPNIEIYYSPKIKKKKKSKRKFSAPMVEDILPDHQILDTSLDLRLLIESTVPNKEDFIGRAICSHIQSSHSPYSLRELLENLPETYSIQFKNIIRYKCLENSPFLLIFAVYLASKNSAYDSSLLNYILTSKKQFSTCINPYQDQISLSNLQLKQLYKSNDLLCLLSCDRHPLQYFLTYGAPLEMLDDEKSRVLSLAIKEINCSVMQFQNCDAEQQFLIDSLDTPIDEIDDLTLDYQCTLLDLNTEFIRRCKQKAKFAQNKKFFETI